MSQKKGKVNISAESLKSLSLTYLSEIVSTKALDIMPVTCAEHLAQQQGLHNDQMALVSGWCALICADYMTYMHSC